MPEIKKKAKKSKKKAKAKKSADAVEESSKDTKTDSEAEGKPSVKSVLKTRGANDSKADATRLYLKEIGFSPLLSAEEEVFFARKAQKGEDAARKRMIESNLRLVVKIARRYTDLQPGMAFDRATQFLTDGFAQ